MRRLWNDLLRLLVHAYPDAARHVESSESQVFDALDSLYRDSSRSYHTWSHIRFCLKLVGSCGLGYDLSVRTALWFHDAVYEPTRADNETRSAALAVESLKQFCVPADFVDKTRELIMATAHLAGGNTDRTPEQACIHDIDLAILGSSRRLFYLYERGIRREYHHLVDTVYRSRRTEVLRLFLSRPRIYVTDQLASRFETQARKNLARLIERLRDE
jgi:predicted metal-dependent HD superfamily phosphohydrolase